MTPPPGNKLDLYLSYHSTDEDYAGAIAQALLESSVKPRIPVTDSDADSRRYNSDLLAKCDAVTLCWGKASEVWGRSEADRLSDWQGLRPHGAIALSRLIEGAPAPYEATPGEPPGPGTAVPQPPHEGGTRLSNERPFPGLRPFGFADRGFF